MLPTLLEPRITRRGLSLRPWDPLADMRHLFELFEDNWVRPVGTFNVDIREEPGCYRVEAELPGVDLDKLDLTVENNVLTIQANSGSDSERDENGYHVRERRSGTVCRSFRLPDGVDADKVSAEMKNGVLTVTLPKSESAKARKVKVAVQ